MSGTGGVVPGPPEHSGHTRHMKPPQPGPSQGGVAGGQGRREPPPGVQHQEHQEFDSWRHQTHQPQQGYNHLNSMASDPYLSSFYAGSYHYPGFGVGDGESIFSLSKLSQAPNLSYQLMSKILVERKYHNCLYL